MALWNFAKSVDSSIWDPARTNIVIADQDHVLCSTPGSMKIKSQSEWLYEWQIVKTRRRINEIHFGCIILSGKIIAK